MTIIRHLALHIEIAATFGPVWQCHTEPSSTRSPWSLVLGWTLDWEP